MLGVEQDLNIPTQGEGGSICIYRDGAVEGRGGWGEWKEGRGCEVGGGSQQRAEGKIRGVGGGGGEGLGGGGAGNPPFGWHACGVGLLLASGFGFFFALPGCALIGGWAGGVERGSQRDRSSP